MSCYNNVYYRRTIERPQLQLRNVGRPRQPVAEGCGRSEFWLHVQAVDHRQQQRRQDIIPLSLRRWLLHIGLRFNRRNRFQSQDRLPSRQAGQTSDLGKSRRSLLNFFFAVTTFNIWFCFFFHLKRTRQGRNGTGRSRQLTTAELWDSCWCTTSPTKNLSTAFKTGELFFFLILFARLDNTLLLCRCTQIKTYSWDNAQVILVGNKCDMEDERVISYERGKQLADQLGLEFFETSAKENINVKVSCQMDAETSKFVDWPDWPSSRPSLNVWWTSSATKCPRAWIAIPTWSTRPKGRGWRTKRPLPTPAPANAEHHQVIHYKISTFSPDAPSKENRIKKTPTAAAEKQNTIL